MGNLHICEATINAERSLHILKQQVLPSRLRHFQGRPCLFYYDNAEATFYIYAPVQICLALKMWSALWSAKYDHEGSNQADTEDLYTWKMAK